MPKSFLKSLQANLWLLRISGNASTWRALKWPLTQTRHNGEFGRLKLRGLDRPVLFRPAATDRRVVWELFYKREYEFVGGWPFKTVVDCGANTGIFMAWVVRAGSREALTRYVGVEPDTSSFRVLKEQIGSLGIEDRAKLLEAAVWDRDGTVNFSEEGASWSHHATEGPGRAVRAVSLGTVLDEAGLDRCDLLKLDIEGGEKQVLESLCASASRIDSIVAELHGGLDYDWFARTVSRAGFIPAPAGKLFRSHPAAVRRGSPLERFAPAA